MAICLEDDIGKKNRSMLDAINSVRLWEVMRPRLSASPSELPEKHSKHVTLGDAKFPSFPRCSSADVVSGNFQKNVFANRKVS